MNILCTFHISVSGYRTIRHCDQGLIVVIVYYFQIGNKKEHNTIISRVISSYTSPIYIKRPCT